MRYRGEEVQISYKVLKIFNISQDMGLSIHIPQYLSIQYLNISMFRYLNIQIIQIQNLQILCNLMSLLQDLIILKLFGEYISEANPGGIFTPKK